MNDSLLSYIIAVYESLYRDEIHRREYMSDKINNILPLYSVLAGGVIWMFIQIASKEDGTLPQWILFLLCFLLAIVFIMIYFLKLLYYPVTSIEPKQMFDLIDDTIKNACIYSSDELIGFLKECMLDDYKIMINETHKNNDRYSKWIRWAFIDFILLCLCSTICLCQIFLP